MRKQLLIVAFIGAALVTNAQVKVGDNPTTINSNSVLEMESTNKGMLLPRVLLSATTAFAPLTAHVEGMMVYNTATATDVTPGYYYNDGTKWIRISSASTAPAAITADNGLAKTADNIQLGGSLIKPTTISTDATNNLVIEANGIGGLLVEANQGLNVLATSIDNASSKAIALRGRTAVTNGTSIKDVRGINGVATVDGTVAQVATGGYFNGLLYSGGTLPTGISMTGVAADAQLGQAPATALTNAQTLIGGRFGANVDYSGGTNVAARMVGVHGGANNSTTSNIGVLGVTNQTGLPTIPNINAGVMAVNPTAASGTDLAIYSSGGVQFNNLMSATPASLLAVDASGNVTTTAMSASDLRLVGTGNHISQDAGVGSNGTSAGTGYSNIIVGNRNINYPAAGNSMTTGFRNIFLGETAGNSNTTGYRNTIVGAPSFTANTTGNENTAFGNSTLRFSTGDKNTVLGAYSMNQNTTGSNNTALGWDSMYENLAGSFNTAVGPRAGYSIQGSRNIAIGYFAAVADKSLSDQMSIGNLIFANGVSGGDLSTGNVGIGKKDPKSKLAVVGLPEFDGNTAAKTGLLTDGDFYRTATGVVMVVY